MGEKDLGIGQLAELRFLKENPDPLSVDISLPLAMYMIHSLRTEVRELGETVIALGTRVRTLEKAR